MSAASETTTETNAARNRKPQDGEGTEPSEESRQARPDPTYRAYYYYYYYYTTPILV